MLANPSIRHSRGQLSGGHIKLLDPVDRSVLSWEDILTGGAKYIQLVGRIGPFNIRTARRCVSALINTNPILGYACTIHSTEHSCDLRISMLLTVVFKNPSG